MTLTPTQTTQLRELISILTSANDGHGDHSLHFSSIKQENKVVDLAWKLDRILS